MRAEVLDFLNEVWSEVRGIDQTHERALGVGIRNDGAGGNLFAGSEHDSSGNAVFDADLGDVGAGTNLRACLFWPLQPWPE